MKNSNKNSRVIGNELLYLKKVLRNNFRSSKGTEFVKRLEFLFAKKFNSKYAISFSDGTSTMHAALEAMNIGYGDEVIVPPLTMSSTTLAVLHANAKPVFADVKLDTFQIDPEDIRKKITKKTKAIISVSLYGLSPDLDKIKNLASKNKIKIIEDNAECFLGYYKNKIVGTLGDCASYSFQNSKHITCGKGGILITKNPSLAKKIRTIQSLGYSFANKGKKKFSKNILQKPNFNRHNMLGWNYRLPELCAAVALAQVENLSYFINQRIKIAKLYSKASVKFKWFVPQFIPDNYKSSYWTWAAYSEKNIKWNDFRELYKKNGGDGIYGAWQLAYNEPFYKKQNLNKRQNFLNLSKKVKCPNAEYLQPRLFQFKTNYMDMKLAKKQAQILYKTLNYFDKKG